MTNSYVAYRNMPLPTHLAGMESHNNTASPLQLRMSEGGAVVTIVATWLNTTIAIRQMSGFLAVTAQVTGHMAFESEGLCTAGCPTHQYIGKCEVGGTRGRVRVSRPQSTWHPFVFLEEYLRIIDWLCNYGSGGYVEQVLSHGQ